MKRRLLYLLPAVALVTCSEPTPPASAPERPALDEVPVVPITTPMGSVLDPEIFDIVAPADLSRISSDVQALVGFKTRNSCSDNSGMGPGIGAARDWIETQLAALPGLEVRLDPWTYGGCDEDTRTLHNVIAWIPGIGSPNRLIVIGGHYDSRTTGSIDGTSPAPGANDSGSQAALLLEVARLLAGHSFDATVVFALWSGEEQGLRGSAAFVNGNYRTYFPEGSLELNLTFDIVGGDNTANGLIALQQFRLFSPGTPREISSGDGTTDDMSPSRGLMRHIGYWGASYVPGMAMLPRLREDRPSRGSDHKSFIAKGVPAVRFIDVNENSTHQHSPDDLYSYVTPAYTARLAQVVAASVASLARAPTPPVSMTAQRLSSDDVKLKWAAPRSGPPVRHYVVSARSVSENFYRTRVVVNANETAVALSVREDLGIPSGSYYVSVAAVDAAGHESLYAYPEYRCSSWGCSVPSGSLSITATR
jgi:acetylornithine deacetylase/succinyl-diaminopimelate desuccinylase-like protein